MYLDDSWVLGMHLLGTVERPFKVALGHHRLDHLHVVYILVALHQFVKLSCLHVDLLQFMSYIPLFVYFQSHLVVIAFDQVA